MITSDIDGLAETITSRLQKIYFSVVPRRALADWARREFPDAKNLEGFVARSFGKPGLLSAMIRDKKFQALLKLADDLLKLKGDKRDFIKRLLAPEDFDLPKFLDALILVISSEAPCPPNFLRTKAMIDANSIAQKVWRVNWHKFLELRREVAYFNLNPRLQLENLFQ